MTALNKRSYRADGGDIGIGRLKEIADNAYGDEEKRWLAQRVLALLDENLQLQRDKDSLEAVTIAMRDDMRGAREKLEVAAKRNAELQSENAYIRNRYKELDLLIGKNILVMQAAIIEWQATGDAKNGLSWIYNTLFGPGELPDESEKDAQAYFDRKYAPIDEELMALHKWFWEQSEAERAAAGIGVKGE
ncbi:ead/Ea22-like family protein [Citrobacter freundii]|uniref:Ead/Ea22-like family protein n=1 Tax=uncultured Citrobacter sp. TaxID=200446 RepID=A0A212ING4_9ENTR|nr:ead/Ea22-like family protein [Citrobacter freundii]MBJ9534148.1 ead/Ea22-like family protein [Citrobacter freundii]MDU1170867.1 ead/Ea22-like family protein [Citrobacter freundii]MDU1219426.1 ead/Ea22-like family protein [Citrobacter freundii]QLZ07080.1 ead/Ea22-like family protein [Citrobacter freundii]SBV61810.1 conserved hypothetical protein [uncultured Citrobacter sp.]